MFSLKNLGIIIYIILIMISLIVMMSIHSRAKKSSILKYLTVCQISVIVWLFCAIIENLSKNTTSYAFVVKKIIVILYFYGPLWLLFTLEYLKKPGVSTNKWRWLIFVPAVATSIFTLINPDSSLIIRDFDGINEVQEWGILFLINIMLEYIYILISAFLIMRNALKNKWMMKENILLVLSTLIPILKNILFYTKIIIFPAFDLTPISFSIFITVSAILVFRTKLFNVLPFAVHELFYSINEAVLIVDMNGVVVDFNPACRKLFSKCFDVRRCKDINDLFNSLTENYSIHENNINARNDVLSDDNRIIEFQISLPNEIKHITCSVSPFKNSSQKTMGNFITFFDTTEYRNKTLKKERVRLSNDLHDSVGNSLNIISSNLEYVLNHHQYEAEINDCLQKSYDRTISLFLDLRRIVEELSPVDIEKNGTIWALETMINKLRNKGINIEFDNFMSEVSLINTHPYDEYIYFICQEAINNAITHGRAKNIQIVLNQSDNLIKLYISDDGVGCKKIIKNKGLKSMQQRVNSLGGNIDYGSPSDGGFNIKISLPVKENESPLKENASD